MPRAPKGNAAPPPPAPKGNASPLLLAQRLQQRISPSWSSDGEQEEVTTASSSAPLRARSPAIAAPTNARLETAVRQEISKRFQPLLLPGSHGALVPEPEPEAELCSPNDHSPNGQRPLSQDVLRSTPPKRGRAAGLHNEQFPQPKPAGVVDSLPLPHARGLLFDLTGSPAPAAVAAPAPAKSQQNWGKLTADELRTLLHCFGLPTDGNKAALVQRLGERTRSEATESAGEAKSASPATQQRPTKTAVLAATAELSRQRPDFAFFDIETTIPRFKGDGFHLLEFGCAIVSSQTLVERAQHAYETLIRPLDLHSISPKSVACNHITAAMIKASPPFATVAQQIFTCLDGKIWVGHNIVRFDMPVLRSHFAAIGMAPPCPAGVIDSLPLLRSHFGKGRAGNLSMATLGRFFGQGEEEHRALSDCRMTLAVLCNAAAVLWLEQHCAADMGMEPAVAGAAAKSGGLEQLDPAMPDSSETDLALGLEASDTARAEGAPYVAGVSTPRRDLSEQAASSLAVASPISPPRIAVAATTASDAGHSSDHEGDSSDDSSDMQPMQSYGLRAANGGVGPGVSIAAAHERALVEAHEQSVARPAEAGVVASYARTGQAKGESLPRCSVAMIERVTEVAAAPATAAATGGITPAQREQMERNRLRALELRRLRGAKDVIDAAIAAGGAPCWISYESGTKGTGCRQVRPRCWLGGGASADSAIEDAASVVGSSSAGTNARVGGTLGSVRNARFKALCGITGTEKIFSLSQCAKVSPIPW